MSPAEFLLALRQPEAEAMRDRERADACAPAAAVAVAREVFADLAAHGQAEGGADVAQAVLDAAHDATLGPRRWGGTAGLDRFVQRLAPMVTWERYAGAWPPPADDVRDRYERGVMDAWSGASMAPSGGAMADWIVLHPAGRLLPLAVRGVFAFHGAAPRGWSAVRFAAEVCREAGTYWMSRLAPPGPESDIVEWKRFAASRFGDAVRRACG